MHGRDDQRAGERRPPRGDRPKAKHGDRGLRPGHHRPAPLAARVLTADTPGPTCPNMRRLNFSRVTRPLYPLDEFTLKGRP